MFLYIFGGFNEKKEDLLSSLIHRYVLLVAAKLCCCDLPGKPVKMQPVQTADVMSTLATHPGNDLQFVKCFQVNASFL